MQLTLLAVGKLRPALREVCDDYLRRLNRFVAITEHEVREAGRAPSVDAQRRTEGARLLSHVSERHALVLLDPVGDMWSSDAIAARLAEWRVEARDRAFAIGGANGVADAVRRRADAVWSLGPLTLPHELARVVVVEQLYRASTMIQGHPYHRSTP